MKFHIILICLCFTWVMGARADGILVGQATGKPLEMPAQTAVLIHEDGMQTLTIWNTVRAEAGPVAWVLPLPTVPQAIQITDPAAVRLMQLGAAPRWFVGRGKHDYSNNLIALILLTVGGCFLLNRRPLHARGQGCLIFCLVVVAWMLVSAIFSGYGGRIMTRGIGWFSVAGVRMEASGEVGNYETTVVSGDSVGQLNAWLEAGGFRPFSGTQAAAAEAYIARKWVFLCSRLKVPAAGLTAVHPLTIRFAGNRLIYPMRLMEGAETVPVDLYVVGHSYVKDPSGRLGQQVTTNLERRIERWPGKANGSLLDGLRTLQPDAAQPNTEKWTPSTAGVSMFDPPLPEIAKGKAIFLDDLLAAGSSITHLSGVFRPGGDWSDVILEPTESNAPNRRYRTRSAWFWEAVGSEWVGLAIFAVFVIGVVARSRAVPGRRPHKGWLAAAIGICALSLSWSMLQGARKTIFLEDWQVERPADGSPDSMAGLVKAWVRSMTGPKDTPH